MFSDKIDAHLVVYRVLLVQRFLCAYAIFGDINRQPRAVLMCARQQVIESGRIDFPGPVGIAALWVFDKLE